MTSERTSPPSGPVASQLRSRSAFESASGSSARAASADVPHERSRAKRRSTEEAFCKDRFFIFNTTVFKFDELRGGGPANRAAIILINCDFAKPGRGIGREKRRMPQQNHPLYRKAD